jgi:2-desacetyl-2-hydroxyethyl bacteriochlorophyllide A dehydrogenase
MKALVYEGPRRLALRDFDVPTAGPGEIVVKVEAVGICGSELEGYLGHSSVRKAPLVMGHEFAGEVVSQAATTTAAEIPLGSKVVINPLLSCGHCRRCREGRPNICRDRRIIGIHRPGAFAEYVAVPESSARLVPQGMDAALASLAEPLAVCIHALKLGLGLEPDNGLLIFGAGPIGLLTLQAAQAMGVRRTLIVDRQPSRLAYAERLGSAAARPEELDAAFESGFGAEGVDTVVDCVGVRQTRETAIDRINAGGQVILVGLGQDETPLPMNRVVRQEISLIGSYTYSEADFAEAVGLLTSGAIVREGWTGACGLSEAAEAFASLAAGTCAYGKMIINPAE